MTKIKFCGLSLECDIAAANRIKPEYIGFVFAPSSKRYVSPQRASELKKALDSDITAVGVFVNEPIQNVSRLLNGGVIDIAQLHGDENEEYIRELRGLSEKPVIKAFKITSEADVCAACESTADFVLLDSGSGTGKEFDWSLIRSIKRPYFLAGGLSCENILRATELLNPYAVDVSSGIETDGIKDKTKMAAFAAAVRGERQI